MLECSERKSVELLRLEESEERLGNSVVKRVSFSGERLNEVEVVN